MTKVKFVLPSFLLCFLLLFSSCGKEQKEIYTVGVDPTWFPLELMGKEANVFAFSNELLLEISQRQNINFERINMSWDNLLQGLQQKKYQAILSSMQPYVFNEQLYDFSELYLHTGPVLIVSYDSDIRSLTEKEGLAIAVEPESQAAVLLEKYPDTYIRYYHSIPIALNDILAGKIDGALVPFLLAVSYVDDLYADQLKIATPPLNNAGLRMITLHDQNHELLDHFNRGLNELKDSGQFRKLACKWNLCLKTQTDD